MAQGKPPTTRTLKFITRYTHFFADLCLQDYRFHGFSPSLLAAAIMVCSRRALDFTPLWRHPGMEEVLGYSKAAVDPVYEQVWAHYDATFPVEAKETYLNEERAERATVVKKAKLI